MTSVNVSWGFVILECNSLNLGIIKKGNILGRGPVRIKSSLQQVNGPLSSPSSTVV